MRHIQKIHFTGRHLGEIFNLPIVKAVIKTNENEPAVILQPGMMDNGKNNILMPGQCLCQDETGKWHVTNPTMNKFNPGDKCRVIRNALARRCVGNIVTIKEVLTDKSGKIFYKTQEGEIEGYVEEACLESI